MKRLASSAYGFPTVKAMSIPSKSAAPGETNGSSTAASAAGKRNLRMRAPETFGSEGWVADAISAFIKENPFWTNQGS